MGYCCHGSILFFVDLCNREKSKVSAMICFNTCEKRQFFNLLVYSQKIQNCWMSNKYYKKRSVII